VAEHFATEHYEIPFSVDAIPRLVPEVARYLDEPVSDPAVLPTYVLAGIAATHVKVVLTGEGADETWGGYEDAFRKAVIVARYRRVPQWIRAGGMDAALRTIPAGDRLVTASRQPGYVAQLVHFDAAARRAVLDSGIPIVSPDVNGRVAIDSADPIGSVTRDSIPTHLAERLLLKVDRTTMAHSLEARVPFLDNDLVRFALGVPGQYKIRGRVTKRLLREAADGLLPEATRRRRKQGFNLPCGEWLRTSLAPLVRELFSTPALPELLHGSFVDELWKEHQTGRRDHATKLWSLVTLQLWARGFLEG
jgi:asparagine synthase (glutamine-hydrolysing)